MGSDTNQVTITVPIIPGCSIKYYGCSLGVSNLCSNVFSMFVIAFGTVNSELNISPESD